MYKVYFSILFSWQYRKATRSYRRKPSSWYMPRSASINFCSTKHWLASAAACSLIQYGGKTVSLSGHGLTNTEMIYGLNEAFLYIYHSQLWHILRMKQLVVLKALYIFVLCSVLVKGGYYRYIIWTGQVTDILVERRMRHVYYACLVIM